MKSVTATCVAFDGISGMFSILIGEKPWGFIEYLMGDDRSLAIPGTRVIELRGRIELRDGTVYKGAYARVVVMKKSEKWIFSPDTEFHCATLGTVPNPIKFSWDSDNTRFDKPRKVQ